MKLLATIMTLLAPSLGCGGRDHGTLMAMEVGQETSRAEEAARRIRERDAAKPAPAPEPVPPKDDAPKPASSPDKYADLARSFDSPAVLRIVGAIESSPDVAELKLKAAELRGRIQAVEQRIEVKQERLDSVQRVLVILQEGVTEDSERQSQRAKESVRWLEGEIQKCRGEKAQLEKEQAAFEARAESKAREIKEKLVIRLLALRAKLDIEPRKEN